MANVTIKFNNKEFILSCEDGQEEHLEELLIQISQKFNNLKDDFEYCRSTFSANHMDLNELAKKLKTYIFYLIKLHKNESLKITEQLDNHHVVEIDLMDIPSFSYDAKNWMIKVNDEDLWYLGR